jgi:hypothetical protein
MIRPEKSPRITIVASAILLFTAVLFFTLKNHRQHILVAPESNAVTMSALKEISGPGMAESARPLVNVPASNAVTPLAPSATRAEKMKIAVEAMNVPVVFYGKVVDQDNAPLAGVKVRVSVRNWHINATSNVDATFPEYEAVSGNDGCFQLDGGRGDSLNIELLDKATYEPEPKTRHTFGYTTSTSDPLRPDPNNPVVFRMWKADMKAQLVTGSKRFSLVPDGRTYTIDLLAGAINESATAEGDLHISIKRPESAAWGQRYDWTLEVQVINGGVVEEMDGTSSMFRAPTDGYADKWRLDVKASDESWSYGTGQKRFYIKSRSGQNYGRLELEVYAYYLQDKQGRLNLTWTLNPAGEFILR